MAKGMHATVVATTRSPARADMLRGLGVDHPAMDDGKIADIVRAACPDGVDAALELVGCGALPDTPARVRAHGTACFTGALDDQRTIRDFGFVSYGGDAAGTRAVQQHSRLNARRLISRVTAGDEDCVSSP
ncbi:hypothetical protein GCM10023080_089350 [Streptomyces pseudoechinosporeus]